MRWQSKRRHRIVSARSGAHRYAKPAKQPGQIVRVASGRQRSVQAGNRVSRGVTLVDGRENNVVKKLSFIDINIGVDPALLESAISQRIVILAQRGELPHQFVRR